MFQRERRKHALDDKPSLDDGSISNDHIMQIHRVRECQRRIVKRTSTTRNHLEAVTVQVERMTADGEGILQDHPHAPIPIRVGDDQEVPLFRGRGSPRRVAIESVQSGIGGVADVVLVAIHEGLELGSGGDGEREVDEECHGGFFQGRRIRLVE